MTDIDLKNQCITQIYSINAIKIKQLALLNLNHF